MSRNQRIGLIVAAVAVAVVAFLLASPSSDDEGERAAQTTPAQTETGAAPETETGAAPPETETVETEPPPPPEPEVTRIRIRGGEVVGGPPDITVASGEVVRIVVSSDAADELHLHGYDVTRPVAPGQPARFRVTANLEGAFELESHEAEHAGRDPLVARLNVEPG